jgi:hypothetical protein
VFCILLGTIKVAGISAQTLRAMLLQLFAPTINASYTKSVRFKSRQDMTISSKLFHSYSTLIGYHKILRHRLITRWYQLLCSLCPTVLVYTSGTCVSYTSSAMSDIGVTGSDSPFSASPMLTLPSRSFRSTNPLHPKTSDGEKLQQLNLILRKHKCQYL